MGARQIHIVIIGAGYAGVMTALRVAGKANGQRAAVTLINASDRFSERIRNHQFAASRRIRQRPLRKLLDGRPISFVQGWVTALDPERRAVHLTVDGAAREIAYDKLVYAVGSIAAKHNVCGAA